MAETFLEMAERHYAADSLAKGHFDWDGKSACSVGCFNYDLGNEPGDFTALSEFSGYPLWAHGLQEVLFEGLPVPENIEWHVQFAKKCETITDWDMAFRNMMIGILETALPNDKPKNRVVRKVISLYHRDNVTRNEWVAAADATWDEPSNSWPWTYYALNAARYAAEVYAYPSSSPDDVWDSMYSAIWNSVNATFIENAPFSKIRDAFLNA